MRQSIGVLGGSFDPVHFGHLRVALEFAEAFALDRVALMPCYQSPHRQLPQATAQQRLAMLHLATADCAVLQVDDRELQQDQLSYTVDSLQNIRHEYGEQTAIFFAMGADAFAHIEAWKDWQMLFALANIVVLTRPSYSLDIQTPWLQQRLAPLNTEKKSNGQLFQLPVTSLGISSTQIRALASQQQSLRFLLPETVERYIQQQRLYQA